MATIAELTGRLAAVLAAQPVGGQSLKLDFGDDGVIRAEGDRATNEDVPADCTLRLSKADLDAVLAGELDPSAALRAGRLELVGDVAAALAMQHALFTAWLTPAR